jgi:hypothetical protein
MADAQNEVSGDQSGDQTRTAADLRTEYEDLSSNMRHHSNLRFAQLTLFVAATGGLIGVVFSKSPALAIAAKTGLELFGLIATLAFFIMEERTALFWRSFHSRAVQLEKVLGYRQYIGQPPRRKAITAHNATRMLYLAAAVFWIIALIWWRRF